MMKKFLNDEIIKNIEYCREIMSLPNDDYRKREMLFIKNGYKVGTLNNVPIFLDPLYMRKQDQVMAMACHNGDIVIDEKLLRLSDEAILWNIYHELGHIKLNHKVVYPDVAEYKIERKAFSKSGRVLPIETEADEYAYKILGYEIFMEGMRDSRTMAEECDRDVQEMDLRIKHFKNINK